MPPKAAAKAGKPAVEEEAPTDPVETFWRTVELSRVRLSTLAAEIDAEAAELVPKGEAVAAGVSAQGLKIPWIEAENRRPNVRASLALSARAALSQSGWRRLPAAVSSPPPHLPCVAKPFCGAGERCAIDSSESPPPPRRVS
jgi:hypothetical protein